MNAQPDASGSLRLTTVNRLGEGRSLLFDTQEAAWGKWDDVDTHRSLYRYASLIDLHHGRVMALFADGGVIPQKARASLTEGAR